MKKIFYDENSGTKIFQKNTNQKKDLNLVEFSILGLIMDENDLEKIRIGGYKVLKELVTKGDKKTENFIINKLIKEPKETLRKHLIMALRLLDTENAMNIALDIATNYNKDFEELNREEREYFIVTIWSLFGYLKDEKIISFLIHLLNRLDRTEVSKRILRELQFMIEEKEEMMLFAEKFISNIEQIIYFKGEVIQAITQTLTTLDIDDFSEVLFKLIIQEIKDLEYNPPKALILSLIYIGNKDACTHIKQVATKYKEGLIDRDTLWVDTLYLALNNICGKIPEEFKELSDLSRFVSRVFSDK